MNKIKRKLKELFIYFLRKIEIKSIYRVYLFLEFKLLTFELAIFRPLVLANTLISLSMPNEGLHDTFVQFICSDSLLSSTVLPVDLLCSLENPV